MIAEERHLRAFCLGQAGDLHPVEIGLSGLPSTDDGSTSSPLSCWSQWNDHASLWRRDNWIVEALDQKDRLLGTTGNLNRRSNSYQFPTDSHLDGNRAILLTSL